MRCGNCARVGGNGGSGNLLPWVPPSSGPISHTKVPGQHGENRPVGKVFHFCEAPTVTAGLIGFVFDIREVIKVARGRGD
jgi:hypothetical protein